METIKIPFLGINRSVDDGISNDGQCMELINARIKNGSVEPIGKPILLKAISNEIIGNVVFELKKVYFHAAAHKYIAFFECDVPNEENSFLLCSYNEDFGGKEIIYYGRDGYASSMCIEFMGNLVCILNKAEYLLFDNKSYIHLGQIPELPGISIKQECKVACSSTGNNQFHANISNLIDTFIDSIWYNEVGYYDNCIDTLNRDGYIFGACLIRYALRMSNGSHIKISQPILVENSESSSYDYNNNTITLSQLKDIHRLSRGDNKWAFFAFGTKYTFGIDYNEDLKNWKNLIAGIDIFIAPLQWTKREDLKFYSHDYSSYRNIAYTDVEKEILNTYIFYKIAEFDTNGIQTWRLDNLSKDSIAIQDKLDVSNETIHSLVPSVSYVYNQRLHCANIMQSFYCGHSSNWESLSVAKSGISEILETYTFLDTDQGEIVVKGFINARRHELTPFMSYPDSRAYKIIIKNQDGKERSFKMKKHHYLDISCYISDKQRVSYKTQNNATFIERVITECHFDSMYINIDSFTGTLSNYKTLNTKTNRPNVLKVSSLNNPFAFPASQTYQPSDGEIIGMCANTNALSQGQFGQHPLYVFSKDGIYAMSVGTGNIVYSNQTPVSRDTCINKNSIKGIDQAVVFASKRGLMMINGTNATLLSRDMDGYLPSCIISSPIISKISNIASMGNALSSVGFNGYLDGAEISYNYQENELYISNKDFQYAYIFNIASSSWSKSYPSVNTFVNKYPECLAIIDNGVYDMQNNHRSITKMLLLSKPIKMGSNSHKRILQTALRGIVKRALSDLYLRGEPVMFRGEDLNLFSDVGFYILGSNDAEHFALISGKESIVDIRDLVTKMNKSKPYKYFMVALVGGVRTDVSLNYIEFIASEAFVNRLR